MKIPIITKHAKKRLKQRLGLAKRAHVKHVKKVLHEGVYLYRNQTKNIFFMQHQAKEYVFGLSNTLHPVLITVYPKMYNRKVVDIPNKENI